MFPFLDLSWTCRNFPCLFLCSLETHALTCTTWSVTSCARSSSSCRPWNGDEIQELIISRWSSCFFCWKKSLDPRNLQRSDPRVTDPEKTWVSNSSIATYKTGSVGIRSYSIFDGLDQSVQKLLSQWSITWLPISDIISCIAGTVKKTSYSNKWGDNDVMLCRMRIIPI